VDGGGTVGAERAGHRVGVPAGVDGLDGAAERAGLGQQLEREGADGAVGGLGVHPDAVQSHVRSLSSESGVLR
jgi:hypothetical protein